MSRRSGKTDEMVTTMIPELLSGEKVSIAGLKNPGEILRRLNDKGVNVGFKPIFSSRSMKAVYNLDSPEGEIIDFVVGDKVQTGYLFYKL